jgi:hypothetical protein
METELKELKELNQKHKDLIRLNAAEKRASRAVRIYREATNNRGDARREAMLMELSCIRVAFCTMAKRMSDTKVGF